MRITSEEKIKKVIELYETGMSVNKVAREVNINYQTAYKYIKEQGKLRKYGIPDDEVEKVRHLYQDEGLEYREIGRRLGIKPERVHTIISCRGLFRENVKARSKSDKARIEKIKAVKINVVEDPIFYVEHKPTNEKLVYGKKKYRDMSAMLLGG